MFLLEKDQKGRLIIGVKLPSFVWKHLVYDLMLIVVGSMLVQWLIPESVTLKPTPGVSIARECEVAAEQAKAVTPAQAIEAKVGPVPVEAMTIKEHAWQALKDRVK